jgi:bifunctional DNA-binding transcriptional regulator/antitoxin component of YhaV-PrlF toxin-antitoxin module
MNTAKINKDPKNRVFVIIPAYLRRKYNLLDYDEVEIDDDGEWIKIRPKKELE